MKTAAAITALAVVGSFAVGQGARLPIAPDSPSSPASNLPPMNGLPSRPTGDLPAPHGSLQLGDDCPPVEVEEWFAPTPRLVHCVLQEFGYGAVFGSQPTQSADVNSDGEIDHAHWTLWVTVVSGFAPVHAPEYDRFHVTRLQRQMDGQIRLVTRRIPLIRESLGAWCIANLAPAGGSVQGCNVTVDGWRDMDGDGDLDICCLAQVDTVFESGDGADTYRVIWFENIGYEKSPPPLAADLNRDGNVDGVDLGLLLAAWGS